ncbi:ribonuclease T2 family protein [Xanthobacter sp. TB0139]|uniref:ribonuclease T2 family protein n=1 Tax=Xanthobacter sp. TB0139 TaxID=3459178 RepID=UPI004039A5B2
MALLGSSPVSAERRDVSGQFDFYVLSLSWSPTYCEAQGEKAHKDRQCNRERPYAFVVHGLWPQYERGAPANCIYPAPYVPNGTLNAVMDIMPSRGLAIHQWRKHGTCSGLSSERYFDKLRAAREHVVVPAQFQRLEQYRTLSPDELEAAFMAANPGLKRNMISVSCDKHRLREVRICMSRDLAFRPCGEVNRRTCRLNRMVMPPVRARGEPPSSSWLPNWLPSW